MSSQIETELIGKTIEEGRKICAENKLSSRIVSINTNPCVITCDYRLDRINFVIEDNIIKKAYYG